MVGVLLWVEVGVVVYDVRGSCRKLEGRVMYRGTNRKGSRFDSLMMLHKGEVKVIDLPDTVTNYQAFMH